ncbi:MAG: homogentisate 1,2-dioxygenase [Zetaproteobacteria bacterium]|nr:homogentisate 1,2-dioxygenase [Zetaproteobacteria bacterium]
MLERKQIGIQPSQPHSYLEHQEQQLYEWVITRDGFEGGHTIAHVVHQPTSSGAATLFPIPEEFSPHTDNTPQLLRRAHIQGQQTAMGKDFWHSRKCLLFNHDCHISTIRGSVSMPGVSAKEVAFANADSDELYFILEGEGYLYSPLGMNRFRENDYLLIPRGIPYHFQCTKSIRGLCISGKPTLEIPAEFRNPHGQLKLEAPYAHRHFSSPERLLKDKEASCFQNVVTLKGGVFSQHSYRHNPYLLRGWDGSVYPITFNILNYMPKTGKYHLPPNLHLTFRGNHFVVCSFVPRMVDYGKGAIPCPYPHTNPSCEEVLYYVSGDFTSRKGIHAESLSYHPMGISHGPQPGKYQASMERRSTDEIAVMIDTWKELKLTRTAQAHDDPHYETSWQ